MDLKSSNNVHYTAKRSSIMFKSRSNKQYYSIEGLDVRFHFLQLSEVVHQGQDLYLLPSRICASSSTTNLK
eukprot:8492741-Ditylum_brightwellii.AAC.1